MRRSNSKPLRATALDLNKLESVHGGYTKPKGTYCGAVVHCECGWVGDASGCGTQEESDYKFVRTFASCPGCGGNLVMLDSQLAW